MFYVKTRVYNLPFRKYCSILVRDKQNPATERNDYASTLQTYRLSSPVPTESLRFGVARGWVSECAECGEGGHATGKLFEALVCSIL